MQSLTYVKEEKMTVSNGQCNRFRRWSIFGAAFIFLIAGSVTGALAQAVPGGTLDPLTIPKYVTPLVIPPVMNDTTPTNGTQDNDYDIAVRQFQQQILPGGIWSTLNPAIGTTLPSFPATTIWSYGPDADPLPDSTTLGGGVGIAPAPNSQFNYPAYTVENTSGVTTAVDWINDLVANPWPSETGGCGTFNEQPSDCDYISHLLPIDQTLHWANPPGGIAGRDSRGTDLTLYDGPVPLVTHVHGAHVGPESDGYPEAWWLPRANNIPTGYATQGTLVNQYGTLTNNAPGIGSFSYPNTQPSATIWYHDHTLGMTRNNVYAGPAGFWLIRDPAAPVGNETGLVSGTLPGPAPVAGEDLATTNFPAALGGSREKYREIPIVIQDRSFNADGSLFYPANRAFFEGLGTGQTPSVAGNTEAGLNIDFDPATSDIAPIWNPEAFFNVMVVNGVSWPELEVAPAIYRFRLLNGCNSRFLNLSMFRLNKQGNPNKEIPFYQIGAEQSLLPQVVEIVTGKATPLVPGVALWDRINAPFKDQALLMGLAERADVLVDFRGLKNGDIVRIFNTAPDAPFGGFPDVPADPATSGQVMQFRVNTALLGQSQTDPGGASPATDPWNLALSLPDANDPANGPVIAGARDLALLEEESELVCVNIDPGTGFITQDNNAEVDPDVPGQCLTITANPPTVAASVPFAPKAAVLGINGSAAAPTVTLWSDPIQTKPTSAGGQPPTETWELWNHTVDGHPIHLHLVKFKVVNREPFIPDPVTGIPVLQGPVLPAATEAGWKDTVIAYPGEVTRVNATFDIPGLYVWHCHIVEHEDNEMMVPYCVDNGPGCDVVP
jgi:FtsP/CotA-like multicopper oxidase with cupredoxin domain